MGPTKSLSFAELISFGSVDAARDHIIEKEVEAVLRNSHAEQFEWLETKFKIKLRQDLAVWPRFIEVTERRNLFVHTGGIVSAQYLESRRSHKIDSVKLSRGSRLDVTPEYFRSAHAAIFEIAVKLAHVLWRKLKPEEREMADMSLLKISFDLLVEQKYDLAKALLDFSTDVLKEYSSESVRLRFVVNRIQAYKWSGDNERALQLLSREDFSALDDVFKLASAVLRDDLEEAIRVVRRIGPDGAITLEDYREWPLFNALRRRTVFETAIFEVFNESLNEVRVVSNDDRTENEKPDADGASAENPEC